MIHQVFIIRDTAVGAFLVPVFFPSEGAARRAFTDEVNRSDVNNMMNKHPEHFQLYYSGAYDDESGLLSCHPPDFVVDAVSCFLGDNS